MEERIEDEVEKPASFRESVKGVWRHIRPHRTTVILLFVLGLISAAANGVVPYITGRFFDALIGLSSGATLSESGLPRWMALLVIWALVQILANGVDWVMDRRRRALDNAVHLGIQAEGFVHLLQLPLAYHANAHVNAVLSKVSYAGWRISAIVQTVVQVAPEFLSIIIGIALATSINGSLALILALGVFVYVILLVRMLAPIASVDEKAHTSWNDAWNDAAATIGQVASVKNASAERYEIAKIRGQFQGSVLRLWYRLEKTWSNISFYQRGIVFLTQLSVFIASVHLVAAGVITVGDLVALNGYALMFFGPFVALGNSWQTVQNGLTSAAQIERLFEEPTENYHPSGTIDTPSPSGKVVFESVSFRYAPEQPLVLKDVSFSAEPGTAVALVGESGAGKSTIAQLISGYYFPEAGDVRVDGMDTRAWDLEALRSRIAVVPQEVALFNDTVMANIRYGAFGASDELIYRAAREAHAEDFIRAFPKGYETLVGERGVKLSVGQKQRLAIARAILRDPRILILDEPTSALDAETEAYITRALDELMKGRTTFIIAHRLSTVRRADKILVLKDGRIAEEGKHDELIAIAGGTYRHLYDLHVGLHE